MKLLWKEWQQQKWIIFWGLWAGISFPILECLMVWNRNGHLHTDSGSGVLLVGGAIFSIILAIATMHHDIRRGADSFWQSKPVKAWRLFVVKFSLAAVLLYIVFLMTISLDLITHFSRDGNFSFAWAALCYTYPIALFLFGLSMFIMVLTRDAAKAAFLTIWAGLLVYFLPLMFRGLEWMNIFERLNEHQNSIMSHLFNPNVHPNRYGRSFGQWVQYVLTSYPWKYFIDHLFFVGCMAAGGIVCVVLSIKAMRYNWRWRPGQKSIVWTMGISAAIIFGFAMFQVGHNLEPVKELNGKKLINPVRYDWNYMPKSLNEGLPEKDRLYPGMTYYREDIAAVCVKDDLMFRIMTGYQSEKPVNRQKGKYSCHFVLQVYKFPYAENNTADSGQNILPDFVLGAVRFFQTEPLPRHSNEPVYSCFTRGDWLYAAYKPRHISGVRPNNAFPGSLNPMYFVTFDISDPTRPKVLSNIEISNSLSTVNGMEEIGEYCYITDGSQLIIISVINKDEPEIVRKVSFEDAFINMPEVIVGTHKMTIFPSGRLLIRGNKLICWSQSRVTIFDIQDRLNPRVIYDDFFYDKRYLYDYRVRQVAYRDNLLYIATPEGICILALEPDENGVYKSHLIGERRTTPIEKLAGRNPEELLLSQNYLIEAAGGFGVLIYDVSDPFRPKRVNHIQVDTFASDIGFWNGLLYVQEYGFKTSFYQLPERVDNREHDYDRHSD